MICYDQPLRSCMFIYDIISGLVLEIWALDQIKNGAARVPLGVATPYSMKKWRALKIYVWDTKMEFLPVEALWSCMINFLGGEIYTNYYAKL